MFLKFCATRSVSTSNIRISKRSKMYSFTHRRKNIKLFKKIQMISSRFDNRSFSHTKRYLFSLNGVLSSRYYKNFY